MNKNENPKSYPVKRTPIFIANTRVANMRECRECDMIGGHRAWCAKSD